MPDDVDMHGEDIDVCWLGCLCSRGVCRGIPLGANTAIDSQRMRYKKLSKDPAL